MKKETILTWLDRLTEYSLYAMVFVLPFSVSLTEVFFTSLLTLWLCGRVVSRDASTSPISVFRSAVTELNPPIYLFVLVGFLSTANSVSLSVSLKGFFIKLLKWVLVYFITVETIDDRRKLNRILVMMVLSAIFMSVDGIFQSVTGVDFIYRQPSSRITGGFSNPNSFAGWLIVMVSLMIGLAYSRIDSFLILTDRYKKAVRLAPWILTGFLTVCLILTYSRGAWIAVILSMLFFSVFRSRKLLITVAMVVLILSFVASPSIKDRGVSTVKTPEIVRIGLWREALAIIEDFPVVGCGFNTYATVGPYYKIAGTGGIYPHNCYLHMAAEMGLLGLGAFLWIMATLFKASLANLKKINDKFYGALLTGLLAGLFGFLIHSFFDTNIYAFQLSILMWFIMGLIIAVQRIALEYEI